MRSLMAEDVRFRLLVPKGPQTQTGAEETVGRYAGWYGDADELRLEASDAHAVGDRLSLTYRFRLHDPSGWRLIEQHLMADVGPDGRLETIDLLCSGFLPAEDETAEATHEFDAGDLGCADGLAPAFRQRMGQIPVGDVLSVTARDPAAKEDLPPLARMMGHAVRSMETSDDGRLVISVERRR